MWVVYNTAPGEPARIQAGAKNQPAWEDVQTKSVVLYDRLDVGGNPAVPAQGRLCLMEPDTYAWVSVPDGTSDETMPNGSKIWDGSNVVDNPDYVAPTPPTPDPYDGKVSFSSSQAIAIVAAVV